MNQGRIIALDVGERRIGVAACDPSGIVVRAVGIVQAEPRERALAELQRIVKDEEAVLIIVGLPLTLRGEHGPQAQRVTALWKRCRPW
jgi:putative Holliday junction resolvase